MEDNYFGNFGVASGYGQPTAGRDVAQPRQPGQPGRPRTAPQPAPQFPSAASIGSAPAAQPFRGAQQTIGAGQQKYPGTDHGRIDQLDAYRQQGQAAGQNMDWMRERTHGGPGFDGAPNWMGNAMGVGAAARGPQAVPSAVSGPGVGLTEGGPGLLQQATANNREATDWYRRDANHENPAPMFGGRTFQQVTGSNINPYEQGGIAGTVSPAGVPPFQAPAQNTPAPPPVDNSAWDTNGYAKPGYVADKAGGVLAGWDGAKWNDPNHQSPKYVVGRIMSQYDQKTPEGRAATIADIQKAYPGVQFNGKDKITGIPGIGGAVDIYGGAGSGEYRPQWLDLEADAAANAGGVSPDLLSLLQGGGAPAQGAAPAANEQQFNSERMRMQIMQALQGGLIR